MTLLYPHFLWLGIPLLLLLVYSAKEIEFRIHLLILLLLLLSLSRPVLKEALVKTKIQGKEMIIALDVSYSMKATDISPDRYTFAVQTINVLLDMNPSDTVMLIVFTSNPLLLSPPTSDHILIKTALKSLNPAFILTKGTSLERLFQKLASLQTSDPREKTLLLITDGGEEHDNAKLSTLLQKSHLSLITLALGTKQGASLYHKTGEILKDTQGHLVISALNPMLYSLTKDFDGIYLKAATSPKDTATKITQRHKIQQHQSLEKRQHHYQEWYQLPLLLATLLFLMLHTRAIKYLLIFFIFLGIEIQASFFDSYYLQRAYTSYRILDFKHSRDLLKNIDTLSLQHKLLLANIAYKTGAFKEAIEGYKAIHSRSSILKQQLYYNIANAYTHLGLYGKAKIYYAKSLQLGFDADTSYNLSLIMLLTDKKDLPLGMVQPKTQDTSNSHHSKQENKKIKNKQNSQTGSGTGSETSQVHKKKGKPLAQTLLKDNDTQKHPLSSKVYELINKGYIYEKTPW